MINYTFNSVFAPFMQSFMRLKKTMGFGTVKIEYIFKEFDLFFIRENIKEPVLTKAMISKWRSGKVNETERTLYDKWSIISQFARYMCHMGYPCYVPRLPKRNFDVYIPYVFTHEQMQEIFCASDALTMKYRNMSSKMFSIPAILRLLYGTGMRVSEAVSLKNGDVNLNNDTVLIRKTKNQQQRLIPLNTSLRQVLLQYAEYRNRLPLLNVSDDGSFFFISPSGFPLNKSNVYDWFKKVLKQCGIPHLGGNHGPRTHDLRHTFAVHSLMAQVKAGADIYCVLPVLSIFLGHKTLIGTERYVRLTQEMFPDIIEMEQSISSYIFPSISKIVRTNEK
jgi:integrase